MKMNAYPDPMLNSETMAKSEPMMGSAYAPADEALARGASLADGLSGRARIRTDMDLEEATRSICVMPKRER